MNIDDLISCPICKHIPVNEREDFLHNLKIKTKHFKKGDWVAQQGDLVNALYILLKGSVKTEMVSESGIVLNIETIHTPNPLAPAFLFSEINQFPVDIIALDDCEVILISKDSITKQLACNETFLKEFMALTSNRAYFLSERLKFLSTKTIKGKIARYVLARSKNMIFTLDMTRTAMAEYFGVTRPSLSRSLSEMIDEDIISLKGKNGKIVNLQKLKRLIMQ